MNRPIVLLAPMLLASSLGLVGCDLLEIDDPIDPPRCNKGFSPPDLSGTWVLRGVGTREGCSDDLFNGSFELGPSIPLSISHAENGSIWDLALEQTIKDFTFSGYTEGDCVTINTNERTERGDVSFQFSGTIENSRRISGDFTGRGPSNCRLSGTFTFDIN
jgi:hypothetical protein